MLLPWTRNAKKRQWGRVNAPSRRLLPRLQLECLEDRLLLSVYYVTSTSDDGTGKDGTLSGAINAVNAGINGVIGFSIGNGQTATINVTGALPLLPRPRSSTAGRNATTTLASGSRSMAADWQRTG